MKNIVFCVRIAVVFVSFCIKQVEKKQKLCSLTCCAKVFVVAFVVLNKTLEPERLSQANFS